MAASRPRRPPRPRFSRSPSANARRRKTHGTGRRIEGLLEPGSRVVVVDDVVTTGGSTLRAIEAVEEAGHTVVAVTCLVDREEGGSERLSRWPYFPLFSKAEIWS